MTRLISLTRSPGARPLRGAVVVLLAAVMTLAAPAHAHAAVASRFALALSTPPQLSGVSGDQYVVLQSWEGAEARRLKRADPHLVVLVYQEFGSMNDGAGPDGLLSSGVGYAQAAAGHPGWLLRTTAGAAIPESGYPYLYLANVGDPGYQHQWATDVVRLLRSGPWDGVFMDDVNASVQPEAGSASIAGYPSDAAYEAAVGRMLAYVGPRIEATGKLAIANFGEWYDHGAVVHRWLRDVDGGMDEKFVKWSTTVGAGYRDRHQWLDQVREVQTTEAMHKRFLGVTTAASGDAAAQLYGWASLLLGADGRSSYLAASSYTGVPEPALAAYDLPIGRPVGAMAAVAHGAVYRRTFSRGQVLVNPSSTAVHVTLHGTYSGSGLTDARAATLAPHTGLVLVGGPAATSHHLLTIAVGLALVLLVMFSMRRRRGVGSGRPDRISRPPRRRDASPPG